MSNDRKVDFIERDNVVSGDKVVGGDKANSTYIDGNRTQYIYTQPINVKTTEAFESQLRELQEIVGTLSNRLERTNTTDTSPEMARRLDELVSKLGQTGKELTAPVLMPSPEDLQIKLVSTTSLERLEEYRSDQATWFAFVGLFLGTVLGILVNWAMGSQMTRAAWILIITFLLMTLLFGYLYHQQTQRTEVVRRKMFGKDQPHQS